MDLAFTEEQEQLAALTRRITTDALTEERMRAVEADPDRFDRNLYKALADAGILGVALPSEDGGGGYGLIELYRVLVELGRSVAPVPVLASIVMGAMPISTFGTPEQRDTWVRPAITGEKVLTAAMTEDLNPDPGSPTTTATQTTNGWTITGTKMVVAAGTIADLFLLPATTQDGVLVFLVPKDAPGLTISRQQMTNKDADAQLELDAVQVPDDSVLGTNVDGAEIVRWIVRHSTVGLCALQLGVCERALELTAEYSKTRVQFERPIATFQAVGQRLAEAYIDVEGVRLTLWQAAWRLAEGLPADQEIATAKYWASDAGHRIAHTTVHVHGGMGIDLDYHAHRYFVGAKRIEFALGTATDHLRSLGKQLAAEPA